MIDEDEITRAMDACASKGWTDVARNDTVAEEFSIALEEICSEYNFGRCDDVGATDALVAVTALALGRDASTVRSVDVDRPTLPDATKKLLDVLGVEILTPLMECADAIDDPMAEQCACILVDALAESCGPRDMFVMALGALQSRVARARKEIDGDDDDDGTRHEPMVRHRGWRLTGSLCAMLATLLRRAKKPTALVTDAAPVVAELAQLCGRCARFVAESHEGDEGRHHGPGVGYGGVGPFFHAAVDATYGQRDGGYALADGMKALALDPRHLFRPNTRGRLCTHPDHDWVLERLGDLRHALSFKDFACNVETGNEPIGLDESDTSAVTKTTVSYVATALIVWRWLVECEETTPWPEVVKPGGPLGDGCTDLTVAQIAPLANALIASERSPTHFSSGLELAALAFRRAPCGVEDGCVAGHELMRKLQVVMARTADSVARESARLGFVRALALHRPRRRLDVLRQCLDAPPPSSAVAAMLLTLVTKETERAWPGKAGEKQPDEPQRPFLPAAVASVEAQIALALDPGSKPGRAAPWLADSACAADVIGAALNALRFVLMREGCNVERMEPPSGAWIRRGEILAKSVRPAAEWAKARLAECDEDDGAWEGRMGFHHVLEVSERIVEFCEERDE